MSSTEERGGPALADALDILNKGEWQKGHLPERWDGHAAERIVQTLLGEHK